ncbi:MAG: hypothetical protein LCH89_02055 [Proteobacteria bacterium]|nr:hypothetical protein [Pseudomonadota bacterium]
MWKWISRLLSPTPTDQAQPSPRVELAALVDLNMTELNAAEARALLAQDLALPNQLHQRLVGFSSAADALLDNARTIPAQSPDWETMRRTARLLNGEFEVLRSDLHRALQPFAV